MRPRRAESPTRPGRRRSGVALLTAGLLSVGLWGGGAPGAVAEEAGAGAGSGVAERSGPRLEALDRGLVAVAQEEGV
ncbi:hypothetical protein SAMN06297387_106204, partial [Streptomyces zhaozhouensis]